MKVPVPVALTVAGAVIVSSVDPDGGGILALTPPLATPVTVY